MKRRADLPFYAALAAVVALPLVFPADAPFLNDEPLLIAAALDANAAGRLAERGLLGTAGVVYGPFPTWAFQFLLALTHHLPAVVVLRALAMLGATALGLWWLTRSLGLWRWFVPLALASPYQALYARLLWDNTWLMPLGALLLAGYADHLARGRRRGLLVAVAAGACMALTHLMSLPLLGAVALHALAFRRRELWRAAPLWLGVALAFAVLGWPYWSSLAGGGIEQKFGNLRAWVYPLLAGRHFGALQLGYLFDPELLQGPVLAAAGAVSALGYAALWGGLVLASLRMARAVRGKERATPALQLGGIAVTALLAQSVLHGLSAKHTHAHYAHGTWAAAAVLVGLAVTWASKWRAARWANAAWGSSLVAATLALGAAVHREGGGREKYGPTLGEQLSAVRALGGRAVETEVPTLKDFPHGLQVLRRLEGAPEVPGAGHAIVRFRDASSAHLEVLPVTPPEG